MLVSGLDSRRACAMTDDLDTPLGQQATRAARHVLTAPRVIVMGLSLTVLAFAGWAMVIDDPLGGEPVAVVAASLRADNTEAKTGAPAVQPGTAANPERTAPRDAANLEVETAPPGTRTVTIIDGTNGKRQAVLVPDTIEAEKVPSRAAKAPALDERFSERGRHGPLPKVSQDGTRPADAFARPAKGIAGKPNAARIAIVVGGLGIGATATNEAMRKLPEAVTLAFAPYGGDLERQVARAREGGHEILLQVPMEPFDYPDNDPGPQTLLTSLDAGQNLDRLHWTMSRLQGYVGIGNSMGGRFSASEQALALVLRETAKRGLIYFDDGSSPRSLASQIAGANNVPFVRADLSIDAVPTPADIDRALARLEALARERGVAVGVASTLPLAIERIVKWASAAEGRGIVLVPITGAAAKKRMAEDG
jgi:polysaccharide deacetylase 2 family uncharacterized protein YibQ